MRTACEGIGIAVSVGELYCARGTCAVYVEVGDYRGWAVGV